MKTRAVLALILSCFLGIAIGAGGMYYMSTLVYDYGAVSNDVADATVDVAVLERLVQQDVDGAVATLTVRLRGSMLALNADKERLTKSQKEQLSDLEKRASPFL
jgi:hypothetical protein